MAAIRYQCICARWQWQRAKKRKRPDTIVVELGKVYKLKRKELRLEINRLKSLAWQELIDSIDKDPWGLPYRIVLKKLRSASPGMTELLEPETLERLLDSLFPRNELADPSGDWLDFVWSDEWSMALSEVDRVNRKVTTCSTKAPGPDGFRLAMWKGVTEEILEWIRYIFDACLRKDEFSNRWKWANLVLIPKSDKRESAANELPRIRPICLIDEIGKAFERILTDRIYAWQSEYPQSEFARNQFGF